MIVFACCCVGLLCLAAVLTLRAKTSARPIPGPGTDLFELSARYRPMLRLLEGSDFHLLEEAGDPKLLRKMRDQRRQIFRSYMRGLRRDHSMLCDEIRRVIVNADSDRSDLASALFSFQYNFHLRMTVIEARLVLHSAGFGTVTAAPLVKAFERISNQARLLAPASA